MKKRIFNLIILDESGSMQCIKREAVSGVNETIQTIRSAQKELSDQEHYLTLVTFNSSSTRVVYDCESIEEIEDMKDSQFMPNAATPLYDAMGNALNALRGKVAAEDRVLVTVITDGMENSSKEYSGKAIKNLVDELKDKGWIFVYIGANQDVAEVAASLSITNTLNFEYSPQGTEQMMAETNRRRASCYRRMSKKSFDSLHENSCFFKDDEE